MGNESSKLKGLIIDKNAVEANDFWTMFNANMPSEDITKTYTIFQGEPIVSGQLWVPQSPMERAMKNLMIYRHPNILKYVSSWEKGGQKHLATERVRPLGLVLPTQSDIQVCLGLRNILCALIFLVEKALARHLNIAISSIYINEEGGWRLGGFEYVWKCKEVTKALLDLTTAYRYKKAVDTHEVKCSGECIEQYAFATLCEDILSKNTKLENTPNATEFREYCATHLKHNNVSMRPKLSAILLHPYFNHEFVLIHSFLVELPLKNPQEKQDFFTGLVDRLRYFEEAIVGSELGSLLLSRMVLLDSTAQLCVTPYVLKTKTDISSALFSNQTFSKYIIPRIKQIFTIRDAQIRLILLEYFNEYIKLITKEELQDYILPHLLLGIKDTNDILVAKTLRCLADLIPLLGSASVVGGSRTRLFADGRPQSISESTSHWVEPRSITPVISSGELMVSGSPIPDNVDLSGSYNSLENVNPREANNSETVEVVEINDNRTSMSQRLSPDGGEDIINITDGEIEEDAWSDWENDEVNRIQQTPSDEVLQPTELISEDQRLQKNSITTLTSSPRISSTDSYKTSSSNSVTTPKIIDDISELDIKIQKTSLKISEDDAFNFFKDMEPVIETKNSVDLLLVSSNSTIKNPSNHFESNNAVANNEEIHIDKSRFEFKAVEGVSNDTPVGWEDDIGNWGE